MMKNLFLAALALASGAVAAQDLLITNARIIDGTGRVIENGSVLVDGERIVSVTSGDARIDAALEIDAGGMTVMPGLINAHWHIIGASGDGAEEAIREFVENFLTGMLDSVLARGVTTIMSAGDNSPDIFDLRRQLADGELRGPRLLAVGSIFTSPNDWPTQVCGGNAACVSRLTAQVETPAEARAKVAELAAAGADALKLIYDDLRVPDTRLADDVVVAITDEADKHGLTVYIHVSTADAGSVLKLLDLGVDAFAHLVPPPGATSVLGTNVLRRLEVPVATTIISTPQAAEVAGQEWTEQNEAMYRNRLEILKSLHYAGVTLAFGTDSLANRDPNLNAIVTERFHGEARGLSEFMSNADVLATMTRNAAVYLGMDDQLGTLEPGKIADIVIVDGDPLADLDDLRDVAVVIQSGNVVVDNR